MTQVHDVAVLGLGAMGSAALRHLARAGLSAVGIERFESPHAHGSSHGESRIIREAYFEDPRYVPLVQRAYDEWAALERDTGRSLTLTTGGVMIGPRAGDLVSGAIASAEAHRLPYELLDAAALQHRFPAFRPASHMVGVWEPRAGVLFPEECIAAHLEAAARAGAVIQANAGVTSWRAAGGYVEVTTERGITRARQLVLATGAWLSKQLAESCLPLTVERVVQAWFEPASRPEVLAPERCPITIWEYGEDRFFYAFPLMNGAVKAALHHQGEATDPDHVRREVTVEEIGRIRDPLALHIPDAAGRWLDAKTCMYTNTPDEHFVLDRHPDHPEVLVVSACSGHGFKFASAIGAVIAELVRDGTTSADIGLFELARFR